MTFAVDLEPHAGHTLERAPPQDYRRLLAKLESLGRDPFPHDVKRVEGSSRKLFRVRVGHYRILYEVRFSTRQVVVVLIERRAHVYD